MWSKCTDGKSFMICGGVAKDAEYRQVGDKNSSLTTFSVKNGEELQADGTFKPMWTSCECWHSVARYAKDIKKGDTVFAVGAIKTDTWTDKTTGEQKSAKKLVCDFVAFLPLTQAAQVQRPGTASGFDESTQPPTNGEEDYPF